MNPTTLKLRRTGKLFLLCALVCAGQLYGMEPESFELGKLPTELKIFIISLLNEDKTPTASINAIKSISETNKELNNIVNGMYGNQKGFTELVHLIAKKYGNNTHMIAMQLGTPAAKIYVDLGTKLIQASQAKDLDLVTQLLEEGADPNFSYAYHIKEYPWEQPIATMKPITTPLFIAELYNNVELVELLLKYGAKPSDRIKAKINTMVPD